MHNSFMQNHSSYSASEPSTPPPYLIESIGHALKVLLLLRDRRVLRVMDVASDLGVARSTAHRILSTLKWNGFVIQDRVGKTYRAGRALIELGFASISEFDVRRKASQHMAVLTASIRETTNLLVLEGSSCRFIDGMEGDQAVRVRVRTGSLLPCHATAGGKVLIADLSSGQRHELLPPKLQQLTENTTTDFARLEEELQLVRQKGYAENFEESLAGLRALAVPISDRSGRVIAALAVSIPADRLPHRRIPQLVRDLKDCARLINSEL